MRASLCQGDRGVMDDWFLSSCDLAVCNEAAANWFLNPKVDHVYCICDRMDEAHIGKRISLELGGFIEFPSKPDRNEIKIARIMTS